MGRQCTTHSATIRSVIGECIRRRWIAARVAGDSEAVWKPAGTLPWRGSRNGRSVSSRAAWNVGSSPPYREVTARLGGFKRYDPAGPRPDDIAQTTTTERHRVDFIVRRERGT